MDEQEIREAAYRLWEKQGKPQGQELEHWFTAEKTGDKEDSSKPASELKLSDVDPKSVANNTNDNLKSKKQKARKA
ncbi:Protein of uncharacterised function (DUF2934) [Pseudomonas fluorescens]|uniref:Protein of uncharacterized function (DUF2934) n=1 Tax=Pseudomonas fluorescens TaxID=294 RepID=A0A448DYT8_PSEFL|nr:DUF2934 domain-containing protein [Pseudomonas fluorescens]VEF11946.1 Protein of uncharacterised function (DUF2934) [Pseudomonas fluorescens]